MKKNSKVLVPAILPPLPQKLYPLVKKSLMVNLSNESRHEVPAMKDKTR